MNFNIFSSKLAARFYMECTVVEPGLRRVRQAGEDQIPQTYEQVKVEVDSIEGEAKGLGGRSMRKFPGVLAYGEDKVYVGNKLT